MDTYQIPQTLLSLPPSNSLPPLTFATTVAVAHAVSILLPVAVIVRLGFGRVPDASNEDALLERTSSGHGCEKRGRREGGGVRREMITCNLNERLP